MKAANQNHSSFKSAVEEPLAANGIRNPEIIPVEAGILVQAVDPKGDAKEVREKIFELAVGLSGEPVHAPSPNLS